MFLVLPIVGGVLLGWKARPSVARGVQAAFAVIAAVTLTLTMPDHGGSYEDGFFIVPIVAVVSATTLWIGTVLARRSAPSAS